MTRRRFWFCLCLISVILTGCRFYPDRLYFEGSSAYPSWPIIFGPIIVNGEVRPVLGHGLADIAMPEPVSGNVILLTIPWVEYRTGASWQADVEIPLGPSERFQDYADLEVRVGRDGAIDVLRVELGSSAHVPVFAFCGVRTPKADVSFDDIIRYHASLANARAPEDYTTPPPPTPCESR